MPISVILGQPKPDSFNHAIAQTVVRTLQQSGRAVNFHDLQAERFDPNFPCEELRKGPPADAVIRRHCDELASADGIVVIHPNYWAMPPAILKGWVDRVLRQGVAYEFSPSGPVGLLKARAAVVFTTANTPPDLEVKLYGDPLDNLWKTCIFGFCGVKSVTRRLYAPIVVSTPEQRQAWLDDAAETVSRTFAPA